MKKCPFKKETNYYSEYAIDHLVPSCMSNADMSKEEFLPCIKEECMAWDTKLEVCLKIAVYFPNGEGKQIPVDGSWGEFAKVIAKVKK
jgi:hypothetical protein